MLYLQEFQFFKNAGSFFIWSLLPDGDDPMFSAVHPQAGQVHVQTSQNIQVFRHRIEVFAAGAALAAWKIAVNFDQNAVFGFALVVQKCSEQARPHQRKILAVFG